MPLQGQRLFDSEAYTMGLKRSRCGLANVKLMWSAWQQLPAASLPNDDRTLARLADFGTDIRAWLRCKETALKGFVLCSDGRFYHRDLSGEATKSSASRKASADKKRAQRDRQRRNDVAELLGSGALDVTEPLFGRGVAPLSPAIVGANLLNPNGNQVDVSRDGEVDVPKYRTGQDKEGEKKDSESLRDSATQSFAKTEIQSPALVGLPDGNDASDAAMPPQEPADAARRQLWSEGRRILALLKPGLGQDRVGKMLGTWAQQVGGNHARVVQALRDAEADMASSRILGDPVAYVGGILKRAAGGSAGGGRQQGPVTALQRLREMDERGQFGDFG